MPDKWYPTPSGSDSASNEEKSRAEDDFEGIDAGIDEIALTRRVYSQFPTEDRQRRGRLDGPK